MSDNMNINPEKLRRLKEMKNYNKSSRLILNFIEKGLEKGVAVDVMVHQTLIGDFIEFLREYVNETSWGNDGFSITFPSAFYEDELEEFGPNAVVVALNYGTTWYWEGVNEQEMCKYLEVAVEFYAKEHPEQEKEVYAYLDKIKEKYHVE